MAKRKKPSDPGRKTERVNVALPELWHGVARKLAAKRRQPVTYVFIDLLQRAAAEEGITDLPLAPWEKADG